METLTTLASPDTLVLADGIFGTISDKSNEGAGALKDVALFAGLVFIVWKAFATRGAIAGIIVAIFSAGILIWAVGNIDFVSGKVGDELQSMPAAPGVVQESASPVPLSPGGAI
ncbi:hypothetical protein ACTHRK_16840 [Dietzia cercidiphylli]|jgi:hypothetical protein|uniref:hypothetical protein n=1 Tax=Dietzia cercidiphylli TaxID=498199 RepID=UPI003F7FCB88